MEQNLVKLPDVVVSYGIGIEGMTAKLVKRTDKKAMYYRWDHVWEVFRIKIEEERDVFGKPTPRHEKYPSNEHFGSIAWCYTNLENAEEMYNNL